MRSQDAVESFRDALKLGPSEAAIYVHLCMAGPAKAGDLAGALKLHRNEVYRTATRLLQRGLIEMTMERPARYAAVAPERVFEEELKARLAAVEELKEARTRITPLLHELEAPQPIEKRSVYKVVQGRQEIAAMQLHMLERARHSVAWASTFTPSVHLAEISGALDALAARVAAGVSLRAVVRTDARGWEMLKPALASPRAQARTLDLDRDVRFLIVDGSELLMWVVNDASESMKAKDEVAILTTASGFVEAEAVFFEQVWAQARPVQ